MRIIPVLTLMVLAIACNDSVEPVMPEVANLQLISIKAGVVDLSLSDENKMIPLNVPFVIRFTKSIEQSTVDQSISIIDQNMNKLDLEISFLDQDKSISIRPNQVLAENTMYQLSVTDGLKGASGENFLGITLSFTTLSSPLTIEKIEIDGQVVDVTQRIQDISLTPSFLISFSEPVLAIDIQSFTEIILGSLQFAFTIEQVDQQTVRFDVSEPLYHLRRHRLIIKDELGENLGKEFIGLRLEFYTKIDGTPKFPLIDDEALLTKVQEQTFKYFWDFGHPTSGLSRERITSTETVTSGGSGFGLMAIIVGIERGFISRDEGVERIQVIVDFLERADRFHGVWSHWLHGRTGKVIPFSSNDDGADLVETSYLAMGLLTVRQYLNEDILLESQLKNSITTLWEEIEWNWHTKDNENVLYWHWSPNFGWEKNLKISGYNEALITYILAASSPTFSINAEVYHEGWARSGNIINGGTFYNIELPLGNQSFGGPLFFEHYTFLGIDPRNLKDRYSDYWQQTVNHTLINRAYCIDNPKNYIGYSDKCWGLTASDGNTGYSAHSPVNDRGVITPTAALSSFPYTPDESMEALHHFYYTIGDRIWQEYGFVDAFNFTAQWVADSYLAIDQGPIILMIENHRTGLLWDLIMSDTEVKNGLDKLGFSY